MATYLRYTQSTDVNIIVDEMLAIREEIDKWREKKRNLDANIGYNEFL